MQCNPPTSSSNNDASCSPPRESRGVHHAYLHSVRRSLKVLLNPPGQVICTLDLLRTMAIFLVLLGHVNSEYLRHCEGDWFNRSPVFTYGWTGVDLFFVLSGFLIGKQLWQELTQTGTIRFRAFVLRRGLRIWPLYYFFLLSLIFVFRPEKAPQYKLWPDFLFFTNYEAPMVSGGWSLSTEEQFYILVPGLFILVLRRLDLARHGWVMMGLLSALPLIRWVTLWQQGSFTEIMYTSIHCHCDGLVAGLTLAWAAIAKPAWLQKSTPALNLAMLASAVVIGLGLRRLNEDLFSFLALGIIYGACVLCSLKDDSFYSRIIARWRVFHVGSRLSFGVYLIHFEVLTPLMRHIFGHMQQGAATFCLAITACTFVSFGLAWIAYTLIEFPFLSLRHHLKLDRPANGRS